MQQTQSPPVYSPVFVLKMESTLTLSVLQATFHPTGHFQPYRLIYIVHATFNHTGQFAQCMPLYTVQATFNHGGHFTQYRTRSNMKVTLYSTAIFNHTGHV